MTDKLTILDLAEVVAAIREVIKPYQLGIQLKIDSSILKTIEKNHGGDIDRQKTEVIEHWLHNSPDVSWTTLANAVERMGGHARLAETLREKKRKPVRLKFNRLARQESIVLHPFVRAYSDCTSLDTCLQCNILLLGKMGHGKSTLGNRILNSDGLFKINDQQCPQTSHGSSVIRSASQLKDYKIEVYDHSGVFEGVSSIDRLSSAVPRNLNLVIFVLKHGSNFDMHERKILEGVIYKWNISRSSALILTHCERLSEEERGEMIEQFKKDHPSIAELMGKGILAVGFPDSSHIQSLLSQRVEEDKASLRQLIYSCARGELVNLDTDSQRRWLYFVASVCIGCLCILCAYIIMS